jgi:hypothetical protein
MMAELDGTEVFLINEHFVADTDTYKTGWIYFPLYDLAPGYHTITVRVWDTYNNPAEATIEFYVSDNNLVIEEFGNFPNPFKTMTTIFFRHNRPGEDLDVMLTLVDAAGSEVKSFRISVPNSTYHVNLLEFDDYRHLHKKLPPGLYFGRLKVRSVTDGSESMAIRKLILAN